MTETTPHESQETAILEVDESLARQRVRDLVQGGIISKSVADHLLIHDPTGKRFKSDIAITYYHLGWAMGRPPDDKAVVDSELLEQAGNILENEGHTQLGNAVKSTARNHAAE
jgi:hypothetical protein